MEAKPVRFVKKQNNYSLHDVVTMGVDLGTINDATCAIYNNRTGFVTESIIHIPEKAEIGKLQSEYKGAVTNKKEELELRIVHLKDLYRIHLAEDICRLAQNNGVEFVHFSDLLIYRLKSRLAHGS